MGLVASLAPAVAPVLRRGAESAYAYMTSPSPQKGVVQRIIRASHEPKNFDVFVGVSLSATTTPVEFLLNNVDQGTGGTQRTGRQYVVEKISLRFLFSTDGTGLVGDTVRLLVFVDKESRGTTPGISDVFTLNGSNAVQTISQFNFDNVPTRFKILVDRRVELNPAASPTTTTTVPLLRAVDIELKPRQRVHCFNTTGGAQGDVDAGTMWCWLVSSTATVSHATTASVHSRIIFRDL